MDTEDSGSLEEESGRIGETEKVGKKKVPERKGRSLRNVRHKKFDDDDDDDADLIELEGPSEEMKKLSELVDMEGTSGDEAPEEESMNSGINIEKLRVEREEKAIEEERKKVKEIRRKNDEKIREEKVRKRRRQEERLKEREEKKKLEEEEPPLELPMELLESYNSEEKPKKIKFSEKRSIGDAERKIIRQEKLKRRLKEVRKMNRKVEMKGPVRVRVLEKRKFSVPVSEIGSKREKWLKRRTVERVRTAYERRE
ncbi:DEKNAAC103141 [Brettanomyces naardenensis]|uniref:DEKNAAC103141 n=1 Tax=Brettanomyces naardenensis TaxID=13370 RepID=A0A448YMG5_BRENA|nr:DEKNAAC103141 [Brettanomyces naardenensis]